MNKVRSRSKLQKWIPGCFADAEKHDFQLSDAESGCFNLVTMKCYARIYRSTVLLNELFDSVSTPLKAPPAYSPSTRHRESKEDIDDLGDYCADTHLQYVSLSQHRWVDIVALVQQISSGGTQQNVKSLVRLAYHVRQSASFRYLLDASSTRGHNQITKIIEKLGKISWFYSSTLTSVHVASKFCSDYNCIRVETIATTKRSVDLLSPRTPATLMARLPPSLRSKLSHNIKEAQRLLKRWKAYVIHAEMQLLLFYEERSDIQPAYDYIGISKRSCFLCATFIRLHRLFTMGGGHQQLYCLWTILPLLFSMTRVVSRISREPWKLYVTL